MAAAMKKCKVCGENYEYCHTNKTVAGIFRWQDVACCPEHGSIYLARILESRGIKPADDKIVNKNKSVVQDFSDLIDDEEDDLFEEDFEDGDDDEIE